MILFFQDIQVFSKATADSYSSFFEKFIDKFHSDLTKIVL